MCGRYIPNTEEEIMEIRKILNQISIRLSQTEIDEITKRGEVYPTQSAPIIYKSGDAINFENAKWGFEKWDNSGAIINARCETVETNKFFSPYVKTNRCIVPAHGYLEWRKIENNLNVKYTFFNKNKGGLYLAGIYKPTPQREFVIITKNANEDIAEIHDRMPLLLRTDQLVDYLTGNLSMSELIRREFEDIAFERAV